jgi:hypothetical protein
MWVCLYV